MVTAINDLGVVFRAAGVALVLDLSNRELPQILYWGADCGPLEASDYRGLRISGIAPIGASESDQPVRISILPEHTNGWMGRPGISGSRAGTAWSPSWQSTRVILNGVDLLAVDGAVLGDAVQNTAAGSLVVHAVDTAASLGLIFTVELSEQGIIRTRATLENLDAGIYQLDELLLCLPTPAIASEVLDFAGRWSGERAPQRRPVGIGTHRREGRRGRTGLDAAMILSVGTPGFGFAQGELWGIHTAWSGNHVHQVERVLEGVQLLGGGELLLPGEIRLQQGQRYQSPWVYGIYGNGLDDSARRMHRHLRARENHPKTVRPVTLNVWEAVYFEHDLQTLLDLADRAVEVGVERFVLDDGWFGGRRNDRAGLGDWVVSKDVWPNGLHELIDRVTGHGMEFGLWFEPEMVNMDSDLARAHPEWVMATGGRFPVEARHQQALNIGIPECYAHIRDAIFAILDEYEIAYIKWDHNRDLVDAGTQPDGRPGVHEQTLAYYRLVDELKERYPGLEIESCSSGGGRVDLEALARTDRVWVSDNNDPVDRQMINRWTTQLVPPEMMGAHIASNTNHITGRTHSLYFRGLTAMFGHLGVEWDLRRSTPQEIMELKEWIAVHKRFRGVLHHGDVVRLDHPDASIAVHGVVALDRSAAVFSFVSMARSVVSHPGRVRFPGLDAHGMYSVEPLLVGDHTSHVQGSPPWWADGAGTTMSGALLASAGLAAPVLHPEQGVLFALTRL